MRADCYWLVLVKDDDYAVTQRCVLSSERARSVNFESRMKRKSVTARSCTIYRSRCQGSAGSRRPRATSAEVTRLDADVAMPVLATSETCLCGGLYGAANNAAFTFALHGLQSAFPG